MPSRSPLAAEQSRDQFEWWALGLVEARVQILTIEELLASRKLEYPKIDVATFNKAPRRRKGKKQQASEE